MFDRQPGIFDTLHALHQDGLIRPPDFSNPGQMLPGDNRGAQLGANIRVGHGLSVVQNDIAELHHPAVRVKALQPGEMGDHLRAKFQFLEGRAVNRLRGTEPFVLGAIPGDRGIDGQHQRGIAGVFRPFDPAGGDFFSPNEIQLIPTWSRPRRRGLLPGRSPVRVESVQIVPASPTALAATASPRGQSMRGLPIGAAITGSAMECPQNFGPHLYCVKLDRTSRLKAFSLKGFDIISERDFVVGTATIIFSHNRWHALLHHLPEMIDGDAFFDRSGPTLYTSGMRAPEVGVQQPQPGRVFVESRGLRFTGCHIA